MKDRHQVAHTTGSVTLHLNIVVKMFHCPLFDSDGREMTENEGSEESGHAAKVSNFLSALRKSSNFMTFELLSLLEAI